MLAMGITNIDFLSQSYVSKKKISIRFLPENMIRTQLANHI